MRACAAGHKETAELLLNANANINAQDWLIETALIRAVTKGHIEIVKLLLKHQADITLRDENESTALEIAQRKELMK